MAQQIDQTEQTNETAAEIDLDCYAQDVRELSDKEKSKIQSFNCELKRHTKGFMKSFSASLDFIRLYKDAPIEKKQELGNELNKILDILPYMQAFELLMKFPRKSKISAGYTIPYFYSKHPNIDPYTIKKLNDNEVKSLIATFNRIDEFFSGVNEDATNDELTNLFEKFVTQDILKGKRVLSKKYLEDLCVIKSLGDRLLFFSNPKYQNALTTSISSDVGFFRVDNSNGKRRELALNINVPFISALARSMQISLLKGNDLNSPIKLSLTDITKELGFEMNRYSDSPHQTTVSRQEARNEFAHKIMLELENIWGVLPDDNEEYKLISVQSYNTETEIITFTSPYLQSIFSAELKQESNQRELGNKIINPWTCDLVHASAANERNRAAIEMATRILVGVQQRGSRSDSHLKQNRTRRFKDETIVTWKISCRSLIEDCPQIREKLKTIPSASRRTEVIKRAFVSMYRILKNKTDLFNYYKDLTITETIPTNSTLNDTITVQHHGLNGEYQRPPIPLKIGSTVTQEDATDTP